MASLFRLSLRSVDGKGRILFANPEISTGPTEKRDRSWAGS